ncbi:MAG: UDP-N-acetylmuramate dehydrogenase [Clostridia bacterium]|nr:UDP-N-acetylmuramate dehydrogenase [Clostridia bacterium]
MINQDFLSEITKSGIICQTDVPMKDHTTFRIGGPSDYYITVNSVGELRSVIDLCREFSIEYMLIGNGSNLLVNDAGLRKAVIRLAGEFKDISHKENTITCGAGTTLSKLCTYALNESLSGLEFAFGIPGTVGGAVFMNAGAYGGEMKDVITSVTHLTPDGKVETVPAHTLELSYRHSIYKTNDCIILSAEFSLHNDDKSEIKSRMDDFMNRRVTKQPLEFPSAGSVFKRPEGAFAGALIEQCGLKGECVGGAQVSEKHSGFIINKGGATCQDVMDLVALVQKTVKDETGYTLEREIIRL